MTEAILQAETVSVHLGGSLIVESANLALRTGELVALVGPNGAGKTTLIRALAGLIPAEGTTVINGRALSEVPPRERARAIAYLPQGNVFHWPLPVADIVALGRHPHGDPFSRGGGDDRAAIARALSITETTSFSARLVTELSGGERARVAVARALATQANVLLADEPTMSLDPRHQLIVMGLLQKIARGGAAVLAILHDLALAARFADRVAIMHRGRLVTVSAPAEAFDTARLASVFGIEAATLDIGGNRVPIAYRALDNLPAP